MFVPRDFYLKKIISTMHDGRIKIITGMRRVGKTFLLFNIFKKYLLNKGINTKNIIEVMMNTPQLNELKNEPLRLLSYIKNKIKGTKRHYILMDEIQEVKDFQMVLLELLNNTNLDIYVTGSNSKFLSSDIVTQFRGRDHEIHLYPLTILDILPLFKNDFKKAWNHYYKFGGLPEVYALKKTDEKIEFLRHILLSTYLLDLKERHRIDKKIELEQIISVVASSIGSYTSCKNIANTFKSEYQSKLCRGTIEKYLHYMQDAFLIWPAFKYNVKGRKQIGSAKKYYFEDIGVRNAATGFRELDESHILENIVFLELKLAYNTVNVGEVIHKTDVKVNGKKKTVRQKKEIDFIINLTRKPLYIQVTYDINSEKVRDREISPFAYVKNKGKNYLIYMKNSIVKKPIRRIKMIDAKQFFTNAKNFK